MAKKTYTVASDEAAERYQVEVGEEIALELSVDEERAVIAAGWVEEPKAKKGKEN
jgi:hypothetical protein